MKKFIHIELIEAIINAPMPKALKLRLLKNISLHGLQKQAEANMLINNFVAQNKDYDRSPKWLLGEGNEFVSMVRKLHYYEIAEIFLSPKLYKCLLNIGNGVTVKNPFLPKKTDRTDASFNEHSFYKKHYAYGCRLYLDSHEKRYLNSFSTKDYKFKQYLKKQFELFYQNALHIYEANGFTATYRIEKVIFPYDNHLPQASVDFLNKRDNYWLDNTTPNSSFQMTKERKALHQRVMQDFEKALEKYKENVNTYQLPIRIGKEGNLVDLLNKNEFVYAKVKDCAVYLHVDYKPSKCNFTYNHILDGSKSYNLVISNASTKTVYPIQFRGNWLVKTLLSHFGITEKELAKEVTCDFPKNIQLSPIFEVREFEKSVSVFDHSIFKNLTVVRSINQLNKNINIRAFERRLFGSVYDYVLATQDLKIEYHADSIAEAEIGLITKTYYEDQSSQSAIIKISEIELTLSKHFSVFYWSNSHIPKDFFWFVGKCYPKAKVLSEEMLRSIWHIEKENSVTHRNSLKEYEEESRVLRYNDGKYYFAGVSLDTVCDCLFRNAEFNSRIALENAKLREETQKLLDKIRGELPTEKADLMLSFEYVNKKYGWCKNGVANFCQDIGIEVKPIKLGEIVSKLTAPVYENYQSYLSKLF